MSLPFIPFMIFRAVNSDLCTSKKASRSTENQRTDKTLPSCFDRVSMKMMKTFVNIEETDSENLENNFEQPSQDLNHRRTSKRH